MTNNGNQPASPTHDQSGLTKREMMAMHAMAGLITLKGGDCMGKDITAKQCVRMADALLAELNK